MDQDNNDNDESLEYLTVDVSSSEEGENEDDPPSRTQTNLMMARIEVLSHIAHILRKRKSTWVGSRLESTQVVDGGNDSDNNEVLVAYFVTEEYDSEDVEADNTLSFEIPLQERRGSLVWKPAKGVGDEIAECNHCNKDLSWNDSNTWNNIIWIIR